MVSDALIKEVRAIQDGVLESARDVFVEPVRDHLRCLVRLTVEFSHYLDGSAELRAADPTAYTAEWVSDSIFSGISSFIQARYFLGPYATTVAWKDVTMGTLADEFRSRYRRFLIETDFDVRCRFLFDLLRLQILFAGFSYD